MKARDLVLIGSVLSAGFWLVVVFMFLGGNHQLNPSSVLAAPPEEVTISKPPQMTSVEILTDTLTVCQQGPPTCDFAVIQEAVDAASDGDLIKIATGVYSGVHARPSPGGYPNPTNSGLITQVVYVSKSINLQGGYSTTQWSDPDPEAFPTTLDAHGHGRVFFISGVTSPTLAGLRITGGDDDGLGGGTILSPNAGGGIYILSASVRLRDNWVITNTAGEGGGIYLQASSSVVEQNHISGNQALIGGGVGADGSTPTFRANTVITNTADLGGGLYAADSTASISGNQILSNTGSGMYITANSVVTVTGNTFIANNSFPNGGGQGGGLSLCHGVGTVISNTFRANQAAGGGALALNCDSQALVQDNTFINNHANVDGGAVYVSGGSVDFMSNTLIANSSNFFAGGMVWLIPNLGNSFAGNLLEGNTSDNGGGLVVWGGMSRLDGNQFISNTAVQFGGGLLIASGSTTTLTNNLLVDNQAGDNANGIYIGGSSVAILHGTIARNHGGGGAGVYVIEEPMRSSTVHIYNTILVSHTVGIQVSSGNVTQLEATLWGTGAWANLTDWVGSGTITTGTINIWGHPRFINPDSRDYHIGPLSAAMDAGIDAGVYVDLDGDVRPFGAGFDIGADESSLIAGPSNIEISSPGNGLVGQEATFIATVSPISTTPPIEYGWQAAGQTPVSHTSRLSDTITFTWDVSGTKVITVTGTNLYGSVTDTATITITAIIYSQYLPLIRNDVGIQSGSHLSQLDVAYKGSQVPIWRSRAI